MIIQSSPNTLSSSHSVKFFRLKMEEKGRIFIKIVTFLDQFFREAQQQPECFLLLHTLRIVQSGTTFIA